MKYGLLGEKLSHSFSKEIHEQIFDYEYILKEVPRDGLDSFMRSRDFLAINVTIPYKEAVIPYLDEIDDNALNIGAVNTIVNKNGKLYGYNTDFLGMQLMLKKSGIELYGKKVLILGSGGTSKTAAAVASVAGCSECYRVSREAKDGCITYSDALNCHTDADVIINTTPCGMYPNIGVSAIDITNFDKLSGVADAIYNPLCSKLVCDAKKRNIPATGGLYMLVAQAFFAAELFTDKKAPANTIDRIYKKLYKQKENLVLTGMPGSGKSTIGKELASALSMNFVDTDDEIIKVIGCPIAEFFKTHGESAFRDIETQVIKNISVNQNTVIATGGGAVLREENIDSLRQNGKIYFIDRPLSQLVTTDSRPLSSNLEDLKRRYDERYDLYCTRCDRHIKTDTMLYKNVDMIKKDFLV